MMKTLQLSTLALLVSCGTSDPVSRADVPPGAPPSDVATDVDGGGDVPVGRSNPDAATNPDAACAAVVTVGLYGDDTCTPGRELMLIRFNLAQDCYGWSRDSNRGVVDNSATRFRCYRDRLCYTQTPQTLACDGRPEDKQTRTDRCTPEPQGTLWTKLLSGTESCPEAPPGFECPLSASTGGTPGVAPATSCTR
jgi:hypothetical protein